MLDENGPTIEAIRLAYHEASHAIIARSLLGPSAEIAVTIKSATLGTGVCEYVGRPVTPHHRLIISAAGAAAERVLLNLGPDNFEDEASADDLSIKKTQRQYGLSDGMVTAWSHSRRA